MVSRGICTMSCAQLSDQRRRRFSPGEITAAVVPAQQDALVPKADLDGAMDRYLDQIEMLERAGPDVDRWADTHQVERNLARDWRGR